MKRDCGFGTTLLVRVVVVVWCGQAGIAQTNLPGLLDPSFDPGNGKHGANGSVHALVLQPDGKAIIAGQFTEVGDVSRRGFARVNTNGTVDNSFAPFSGIDDYIFIGGFYEPDDPYFYTALVEAAALQSDGKVILG